MYQGDNTTCSPNPCPPPPGVGACCVNGDCIVVSASECAAQGGEYQGDGTMCTPDLLGEPGMYRLGNHPDVSLDPPPYGLRIDNLIGFGVFTFDFEAPGAEMFLLYDGSSIQIFGTAFGGKDIGNFYDPNLSSFVDISMTYTDVGSAGGDDDLVSLLSNPADSGSLIWLQTGQMFTLMEKSGPGFSFRFGNEDHDFGHRGFPGLSGWGWLQGSGTRDWIFTAHGICPGDETGACCFGGGDGDDDDDDDSAGGAGGNDGAGGDDDDDGGGGMCLILTEAECNAQGGTYQGDGTTCDACGGGGGDDDDSTAMPLTFSPPEPPALGNNGRGGVPGDVNGDGRSDLADLAALIGAWGICPADCPADLNRDGVVELADLKALLGIQ
jgi:hypothetical protein